MQICSRCQTQSSDQVTVCPTCQAILAESSTTSIALKKFQTNSRVNNLRLVVADDSCPACQLLAGTYEKKIVPILPNSGCSNELGCRCFYVPLLDEIYP